MAMDLSSFYVDFSGRTDLTADEKTALELIQKNYRPIERVDLLIQYKIENKISSDEYEMMTGLPYSYDI